MRSGAPSRLLEGFPTPSRTIQSTSGGGAGALSARARYA